MKISRCQAGLYGLFALVAVLSGCGSGGGGGESVTTYTIGGTISGLSGSGLVLQNNGGDNLSVASSATSFTFVTGVASGATYSVAVLTQPATPSQSCKIVNGSGTVVSSNVTNIAITCIPKNEHVSHDTANATFGTYYDSYYQIMSSDGRYVVFESSANLASGSNTFRQIYLRDRQTNQTELISVSSDEIVGNSNSFAPAISSDGRYVAFESESTNLVASDSNAVKDIFLRDRQAGTTIRASVGVAGVEANGSSAVPSLSADGRYLAFYSYATNLVGTTSTTDNIFLRDLQSGTNTLISVDTGGGAADGVNNYPSISADGSRIAFWSYASDLVAGDTNGLWDIFLYDANATPKISLISVSSGGVQKNQGTDSISGGSMPTISADGNVVAFATTATNLVSGDTNGARDVFIRKISTSETIRASVGNSDTESNGNSTVGQVERIALSSNGNLVAFTTSASNIAAGTSNVLLRNVSGATTTQITTVPDNGYYGVSISGDGRFVGFGSASQLDTRYSSTGLFVQDTTSP